MKSKFIVTQDDHTAKLLLRSGFKVVSHNGSSYTFLNDMPIGFTFDGFDKSKIVYTNIMTI